MCYNFTSSLPAATQATGDEVEHSPELRPIFILTAAVGAFFILLWLFWALTFWWSKISQKMSEYVSFSLIVALWFILCFISVAVASSLTTLVVEHNDLIFGRSASNVSDSTDFPTTETAGKYEIVPLVGLGAILVLWTVHVCVFLVNVCCSTFGKNSPTTQ